MDTAKKGTVAVPAVTLALTTTMKATKPTTTSTKTTTKTAATTSTTTTTAAAAAATAATPLVAATTTTTTATTTTTTTTAKDTSTVSSTVTGTSVLYAGATYTTAAPLLPAEPGTVSKEKMTESQRNIHKFWPAVLREVRLIDNIEPGNQLLPLARIKKIMKLDEDVRMISSDAPLLFAKAVELFIQELTMRAWLHTEYNKRRTLQRSDIAMAITKYDQFDFLIDIVPRDEIKIYKKEYDEKSPEPPAGGTGTANGTDDVQYYLQLAQQHQLALQHPIKGTNGSTVLDLATVIGAATQQHHIAVTASSSSTTAQVEQKQGETQASSTGTLQHHQPSQTTIQTASGHSIVLANGATTTNGIQSTSASQLMSTNQHLQLLQHVVTPSGEITQIPISIPQNQLNFIRTAGSAGTPNGGQPIFIQTAPMSGPTIIHTGPTGVFLSANQLQQLQQQQQQQQQMQQQQQNHHQQQSQQQPQIQSNHQQVVQQQSQQQRD